MVQAALVLMATSSSICVDSHRIQNSQRVLTKIAVLRLLPFSRHDDMVSLRTREDKHDTHSKKEVQIWVKSQKWNMWVSPCFPGVCVGHVAAAATPADVIILLCVCAPLTASLCWEPSNWVGALWRISGELSFS